jgi:serine phosphatase RsbU (regulator of sigma subunit)
MAVAHLQQQSAARITHREARSVPCAGDFTDVFPYAADRANIVIADVCGRDARAQAHAAYLRQAVRVLANDHVPASTLESVNRAFCRRIADFGGDHFASLFVAALQGRHLTYASAGHDFAMLISANGQHRHLPPTGVVVGINELDRYHDRTVAVTPGEWLILVTDGVTDARNAEGEFFGTRGVVRTALSAIEADLDDPAARILEAAQKHSRGRFVDDASVLCIRFSEFERDSAILSTV